MWKISSKQIFVNMFHLQYEEPCDEAEVDSRIAFTCIRLLESF